MAEEVPSSPTETPDPAAGAPPPADGKSPSPDPSITPPLDGAAEPSSSSADGADPGDGGAPDATLAEGGGGEDQPQAVPAEFPPNWREVMAGGDDKLLSRLKRFSSPANLTKSWLASQQKIGSGELIRAKPDGSDEGALNEWRASVGIPETADGYLEKLPDGLVIGEDDKAATDTFTAAMHAVDAPPEYVHQALKWYHDHQEQVVTARALADREGRQTTEDELRSEWGPEFRANVNGAVAVIEAHGAEGLKDKFFSARLADGTPLGDDPDTLRFLTALNRQINPAGTITPAPGQTPLQTITAEKKALESLMPDRNSAYWKGPEAEGKQARWRELDDMERSHGPRAA